MFITIKTYSIIRNYLPDLDNRLDNEQWEFSEGMSVEQVIQTMKLPQKLVSNILLNGSRVDKKQILHDGDVLHIFPPLSGG